MGVLSSMKFMQRLDKASAAVDPVDGSKGWTMKVIVDVRRLSRAEQDLLIERAIKKAEESEIVVLADNDDKEEVISRAARNHGWILKGIERQGENYRITLSKH